MKRMIAVLAGGLLFAVGCGSSNQEAAQPSTTPQQYQTGANTNYNPPSQYNQQPSGTMTNPSETNPPAMTNPSETNPPAPMTNPSETNPSGTMMNPPPSGTSGTQTPGTSSTPAPGNPSYQQQPTQNQGGGSQIPQQ